MKTLQTKQPGGKPTQQMKKNFKKNHPSKKESGKSIAPFIYNEYEELEILNEFFTRPNYLEDYLA